MGEGKKGGILNGGLTIPLRNIIMIIAILTAFASAVIAVTSRASKPELASVKERVKVVEVKGDARDKQLDKIEEKIDWLIKHQK